ncbi:glycerol-3-phosphate dehydrogenase/oxidase [Nesterenkonia lacusekhoensis]|uniref:Glycerol-3-phosphate dehydrogenase n=1 Tax=Nesterenkonia lacusekhoensis TaxID=150832 RepID=A0ABS4SY59_9MICC|nr:glycerol-3-phosphate dehydrogenase/oxidase [Nesterenkonia lacusekhoensis]MBP2317127.1 glycerol-3-phosphate dehydrogenase [Nesterenkonia lacusekhoensis]
MNSTTRQQALDAMAGTTPENPLDVLVVGGGVVGAAAAFDASTRGLQVGLVEARDLAQGTSSRSSKLVHGGLRYLQMLDFKLVAEALRERNLLMTRTAPHLVKGLPFVFPFEHRLADRAFIGSGVTLYDGLSTAASALGNGLKSVFSGAGRAPLHRHMSRKGLQKRFAGLDHDKFIGALEYFDAQVDDARLVMTLARSAASLGAHVAVRTEVTEYLRSDRDGEEIVGVVVRDRETGAEHRVYARETIMAAGVWTGDQEKLAHAEAQDGTGPALKVLASKGIHITVPKDRIPAQGHVGVITQTDKSVLFIIPMGEYWSVGTTDTAWHEAVDVPAPNASDIDYVLEHANAVLETDLTHDDVIGTWAGLRPLLQPVDADEASSSKVSREHTVMRMAPGLSAVAGGKLTTYRSMAQDAVDFAIAERHRDRSSLTEHLPLLGAQGYGEWAERADDIAAGYNLAPKTVQRLLGRYGSLLSEVLELIDQRPELGEPVPGAAGYLGAEYVYAARCEGAVHLEDLLERRTRLFHEVRDRGLEASEHVAALVAAEIGWDEAQTEYELRAYASYVEAHRAAERAATDAEAAELMRAVLPAQQVLETS